MTDLWTDPASPLEELAQILGLELNAFQLKERPDYLSYDAQFNPDTLTSPASLDGVLKRLREKYADALTFDIRIDDLAILTLNAAYESSQLNEFFERLKRKPALILDFKIDKQKLLARWLLTHPTAITKIFLFPKALVRALDVPLLQLAQGKDALLPKPGAGQQVLIFVPDHEIELSGDYLAVLGGKSIAKWTEYVRRLDPVAAKSKIELVYKSASRELKRENVKLGQLTPLHLLTIWKRPKDGPEEIPATNDAVACSLFAQLVACSLLYMAGESRFGKDETNDDAQPAQVDGFWIATFKADKDLASIEVGSTAKITSVISAETIENPLKACRTIGELSRWVYQEELGIGNRIEVVQVAIANYLQDNKPADNLRQLLLRADEIFARVKRLWEQFVGEKLDKYFLHVKELEETVESTTKAYNEHVQSLTTTLTGNMLAAVAVIVGSFLAAIFKSPFEANVFLFGVGIYLAYLTVFPIGIGLVSAWQRFSDSRDVFKKRKEDFSKRLGDKEVEDIVAKTVSDRETWFKRWFGVTIFLYAVVLILVVVALVTVPNAIKRWSDDFKLAEVAYGEPVNSEAVPMVIRGENFDKEKEIVVSVGHSKFTNTDEQSLQVHGSTVLRFSFSRTDLDALLKAKKLSLEVRQGASAMKITTLPTVAPAVPTPQFTRFSVTQGGDIVAEGSNFDSIVQIGFKNVASKFEVSSDGRKLTIKDHGTLKELPPGTTFDITLKDNRKIQVPVTI